MAPSPISDDPDEPTGRPDPDLYPELVTAGSMAAALESIAAQHGLDLGAIGTADGPERLGWASVYAERGRFSIGTASLVRCFLIDGSSKGVRLIWGRSTDLTAVARAAAAWRGGSALRQIQEVGPFVEFNELSEAHERGPADAVAAQWRSLRSAPRVERARPVLEAAYEHPVLRRLLPVLSHGSLHFSTCTGYPYSWDVPYIEPLDSGYRVAGPRRGSVIGTADSAADAVSIVVEHLPADCGPAVAGTAADLPTGA
jgi:hypothetical protein